jgi:hypothetical protein
MRASHASDAAVNDTSTSYDKRSQAITGLIRDFVLHHPLRGKIGAFEGGGFVPKGFYRPTVNSMMHMFYTEEKTYYKVNEEAIIRVIRHFTE